jgi:hypothetical protein
VIHFAASTQLAPWRWRLDRVRPFDRHMFADALGALTQITDAAFAEYGTPAQDIADLRDRFAA